tara:strand:+ start:208 stop:339 length:132 start_codon:yes stop_codon:yes gene_type:complete
MGSSDIVDMVKDWKEGIDKLNAETDKRLESFLKMSKQSRREKK